MEPVATSIDVARRVRAFWRLYPWRADVVALVNGVNDFVELAARIATRPEPNRRFLEEAALAWFVVEQRGDVTAQVVDERMFGIFGSVELGWSSGAANVRMRSVHPLFDARQEILRAADTGREPTDGELLLVAGASATYGALLIRDACEVWPVVVRHLRGKGSPASTDEVMNLVLLWAADSGAEEDLNDDELLHLQENLKKRHTQNETASQSSPSDPAGSISAEVVKSTPPPRKTKCSFVRQFKSWLVQFDGEQFSLPHRVGFLYVAVLLNTPDVRVPYFQMKRIAFGAPSEIRREASGTERSALLGDIGGVLAAAQELPARATRVNQRTGREVRHDAVDADEQEARNEPDGSLFGDDEREINNGQLRLWDAEIEKARAAAARGEEDAEMRLKGLIENRGKARTTVDPRTHGRERFRKSVSNALDDAIDYIEGTRPRLGAYLRGRRVPVAAGERTGGLMFRADHTRDWETSWLDHSRRRRSAEKPDEESE